MWPSEAVASLTYNVANIVLIASLVAGAASTVLVVWMGNVKEEYLRTALANVNTSAALAGERAAQANERAATANKEAAEAKLALERYRAPRTIAEADAQSWLWLSGVSATGIVVIVRKSASERETDAAEELITALNEASVPSANNDVPDFWQTNWGSAPGLLTGPVWNPNDKHPNIRLFIGVKN